MDGVQNAARRVEMTRAEGIGIARQPGERIRPVGCGSGRAPSLAEPDALPAAHNRRPDGPSGKTRDGQTPDQGRPTMSRSMSSSANWGQGGNSGSNARAVLTRLSNDRRQKPPYLEKRQWPAGVRE